MPEPLTDLRPSPIAGTWYPADPHRLRKMLQGFLDAARLPDGLGQVQGIVVPHAGYIYSGATAAHAFKVLEGQAFQQVIIISPSHHHASHPVLSSGHAAYQTPLGPIEINKDALAKISRSLAAEGIELGLVRNDQEHSLEIELPFLQMVLPAGFQLIPLMQVAQTEKLGQALKTAILAYLEKAGKSTLLVASSDLSHFYSQDQAQRLDGRIAAAIEGMDSKMLYRLQRDGQAEACGLGPMATVIETCAALGASQAAILDYRTSAAASGDTRSVVGYLSAVFSRPG